jgi:hypothetical protein
MCPHATATKAKERRPSMSAVDLPGAWYDLTARLGEAKAVASCALESLPSGLTGVEYDRMNHTSYLVAAVEDILKLMGKDISLIEEQMGADAQRYAKLEKFTALYDALEQAVPN